MSNFKPKKFLLNDLKIIEALRKLAHIHKIEFFITSYEVIVKYNDNDKSNNIS